jgi:hypothetical protein
MVFKLLNDGNVERVVDLECDAALCVNGLDDPALFDLPLGRGFVMLGGDCAFSFVGRSYPLVRDVATYWFGSRSNRTLNYWNQVAAGSMSTAEAGCVWSWQGISIGAGQFVTRSVIFRAGVLDGDPPDLSLSCTSPSTTVTLARALSFTGGVQTYGTPATSDLLLVVDDDLSDIRRPREACAPGSFILSFNPSGYRLGVGLHPLRFHAVDNQGRVSTSVSLLLKVVPVATRSLGFPPSIPFSPSGCPRNVSIHGDCCDCSNVPRRIDRRFDRGATRSSLLIRIIVRSLSILAMIRQANQPTDLGLLRVDAATSASISASIG